MTDPHRRALASYVRETADVLGLVEWKLVLEGHKPPGLEDDAAGHCHVTFGHAHARLWFEDSLPQERPDWQRYIVVHELLHIPLFAPWGVWQRPCSDLLGPLAMDAIQANAVTAWELTIDRLARAIGPLLPYPNWSADPDSDWIGDPDEDGDLILYSRMYDAADRLRPVS